MSERVLHRQGSTCIYILGEVNFRSNVRKVIDVLLEARSILASQLTRFERYEIRFFTFRDW